MINLNLKLSNPKWSSRFDTIKWWAGETPFKHKFWEVQAMKTDVLVGISFDVNLMCDHAGVRLNLGLFGHEIDFHFYDNRHWNYEKGRYNVYSEDEGWN